MYLLEIVGVMLTILCKFEAIPISFMTITQTIDLRYESTVMKIPIRVPLQTIPALLSGPCLKSPQKSLLAFSVLCRFVLSHSVNRAILHSSPHKTSQPKSSCLDVRYGGDAITVLQTDDVPRQWLWGMYCAFCFKGTKEDDVNDHVWKNYFTHTWTCTVIFALSLFYFCVHPSFIMENKCLTM